ncbi:MAG: 3-oxoadipate enol-lactonase / 4-carboxymuconolactone decarboxylase [Pseudonocardiales bacterium]|nr:3-oxoadipate enol-lactonase / 4-carboxymuconolactone decarboxylase [Pseudonocardiales bacterium]
MIPKLALVDFGAPPTGQPAEVLVVGPSIGTSIRALWGECVATLTDRFHVVGWDLPGHGASPPASDFDVDTLAAAVLGVADDLGAVKFHYAGDSLGGCVGLALLLTAPDRITSATVVCTGARIGEPAMWRERAAAVRAGGTAVLLASAPGRWFGPGFADRAPRVAEALLDGLRTADDESYAAACDALAAFDLRSRLAEISAPVLAVAGEFDVPTPPVDLRSIAAGVQHGRFVQLSGVGHLAPAEAPDDVARLIVETAQSPTSTPTAAQLRAAGMRVRREVLGAEYVDAATAGTSELTADFQDLITEYAWGRVWTRPGLDRRSRSMITITALVARGHFEELAVHLRAARTNGLTDAEIVEVLLQTAIYCGVPAANAAFRVAAQVLAEPADEAGGGR